METLIIVLLVALITGGVATIGTLALVMLGTVYLNTKPKKEDEEEGNQYMIPIAGGGNRIITPEDVEKARAAYASYQASHTGGDTGCEKKEEYVPNEGSYI